MNIDVAVTESECGDLNQIAGWKLHNDGVDGTCHAVGSESQVYDYHVSGDELASIDDWASKSCLTTFKLILCTSVKLEMKTSSILRTSVPSRCKIRS